MESRNLLTSPRSYPNFIAERPLPVRVSQRWFTTPLVAALIILPVSILFFAPVVHRLGMLLAYGNILIIGLAMVYFVRQRTFEASLPILFLTWLVASWPISSIYFGFFDPDAAYITVHETREPLLDGNLQLQAVTMVFVLAYLMPVILLNRSRNSAIPSFSSRNPATNRFLYLATALTIFAYGCGAVTRLTSETGSIVIYVMLGVFLYSYAIPLIVGVLSPKTSYTSQIWVFGFLGATSLLFIMFNHRFFAIAPWAMILFGYLFFGESSARKKLTLLAIGVVAFPLVLVIGDTVRTLSKGKYQELSKEERHEFLNRWDEWLSHGSVLSRTFSRLFSPSGHAIITRTPDEVPYLEFDAARFAGEFFTVVFVPNRFYYDPFYSTTFHLNDYDHRVTEKTSEELTLPGSLWMLGGLIPVILGAIAAGLLHSGVMVWIKRAARKSPYQGLFYLAMIAGPIMFGFNLDIISHTRALVRGIAIAIVVWYCLVKWVLGRSARNGIAIRPTNLALGARR
jgi:hypothetical protein